jgi:hypothetical protein
VLPQLGAAFAQLGLGSKSLFHPGFFRQSTVSSTPLGFIEELQLNNSGEKRDL